MAALASPPVVDAAPPKSKTRQSGGAKVKDLPGKLPTNDLPSRSGLDFDAIARGVLARLVDGDDLPGLFVDDALFRDQFALTGTFRTIYGGPRVAATYAHLAKQRRPQNFALVPGGATLQALGATTAWIEAPITFETTAGGLPARASGFLNIVPGADADSWKLWSLYTMLEDFTGHEMSNLRELYPEGPAATNGVNGVNGTGEAKDKVDLIIVGAGQSGLGAAGYAKAAGLSYVLIERNAKIGDNWVLRYDGLYLHTPHRFNDLAFGPTFSNEKHNEWLTTHDLADGYQSYVDRYHINVWLSANIQSCDYREASDDWHVVVDVAGEKRELTGANVALCTGPGGTIPLQPHIPGQERFRGTIMHSKNWKSAKQWAGKRGIVIGTANTGHDVAEEMERHGMHCTMIQRSKTYVIPRDYMTMMLNYVWNPNRSSDASDRAFWAPPTAIAREQCAAFFGPMFERDAATFDALHASGFVTDPKACFIDHLLVRFGGHFMDHGASAKIAEGRIKVKSGHLITGATETGIVFDDGEELPADLVVFATGFEKDITESVEQIVGPELARRMDPFFGVDEEGEIRGAWKPCGVPHLYMAGGGCAHGRYFPRFIALQALANKLGQPLVPYEGTVEPGQA